MLHAGLTAARRRGGRAEPMLRVQYLCDRRTVETAEELLRASVGDEEVRAIDAVHSAPTVVRRCVEEHPGLRERLETRTTTRHLTCESSGQW